MEEYIKSGRLAPDAVVIGMIANYVAEHRDAAGNIFDGFPRTTIQAEEFDKILGGHGLGVTLMVDMHVPEEELVRRIRCAARIRRADDASEDVIRNRIKVYREQTEVVGAYYARQNKYFRGRRRRLDGRGLRPDLSGGGCAQMIFFRRKNRMKVRKLVFSDFFIIFTTPTAGVPA